MGVNLLVWHPKTLLSICSPVSDGSLIIKPVTSFISLLRHWGAIGVLLLAALDSSVLPTLGAVDALTILLAARRPDLWPYYAMCSTAGSRSEERRVGKGEIGVE